MKISLTVTQQKFTNSADEQCQGVHTALDDDDADDDDHDNDDGDD